jgi:hypothetical protein
MTPISARSAQTDQGRCVDALEQLAGLLGGEHRGFATLDDVLRAAHRVRRVDDEHAAGDEPVEQHADRSKMLFHGWLRHRRLQALDVGSDMQRFDIDELTDLAALEPDEESAHGTIIGLARILVADGGGEKLEKAAYGMFAGTGNLRPARPPCCGILRRPGAA